ncbi:hypothetical protein [Agrococcus casei]|uniref:hypothetical protein n=1 Tax=Agrococcus casei TaxID=343512 RepID=UPI003F91508F
MTPADLALAKERYEQAAKHDRLAEDRMHRARSMFLSAAMCCVCGSLGFLLSVLG